MNTLLPVVFLVLFAVVLLAVSIGLKFAEKQQKKRVTGMLQTAAGIPEVSSTSVLRSQETSGLDSAGSLLERFNFYTDLQAQIPVSYTHLTLPTILRV